MSKKPKTNREAYDAILALYGRRWGAKTKFAKDLGVSRQCADSYAKNGIPRKYWKRIRELHGLTPDYICPEYF